jgi:hypothetical protein
MALLVEESDLLVKWLSLLEQVTVCRSKKNPSPQETSRARLQAVDFKCRNFVNQRPKHGFVIGQTRLLKQVFG